MEWVSYFWSMRIIWQQHLIRASGPLGTVQGAEPLARLATFLFQKLHLALWIPLNGQDSMCWRAATLFIVWWTDGTEKRNPPIMSLLERSSWHIQIFLGPYSRTYWEVQSEAEHQKLFKSTLQAMASETSSQCSCLGRAEIIQASRQNKDRLLSWWCFRAMTPTHLPGNKLNWTEVHRSLPCLCTQLYTYLQYHKWA